MSNWLREWPFFRWCLLGWYDFVLLYRRTVVGPLWQTLQPALWAFGLIVVFGRYHSDQPDYVPYVVSGVVIWGLLSSCLMAGPSSFTLNSALILNIPNPLALYVVRALSNLTLRFAFQFLVFVVVAVIYQVSVNATLLLFIPGIMIMLVFCGSAMMVLGVVGAQMRDLEHLVSSLMRFLFFATPVFWMPTPGSSQAILAAINPLTYFLDLVRLPLLGQAPPLSTWLLCVGVSILSVIVAVVVHRRFGRFVPAWL